MFQLHHLLHGAVARERCQEITRQVQRHEIAREIKNAKGNRKVTTRLRAILVALINLITR
jgi:hypothetical protein